MRLFKNKYRTASIRWQGYDYTQEAYYYVTICTEKKQSFFGRIVNSEIKLSKIGKIADKYWQEIPNHFPQVVLDDYVIMPNHIHGILQIIKRRDAKSCVSTTEHKKDAKSCVSTTNMAMKLDAKSCVSTVNKENEEYKNKFGPQANNLSSIIRGYKAGLKKYSTMNNINFAWQPRFFDRVVRTEKELHNIREYIKNNIILKQYKFNYN